MIYSINQLTLCEKNEECKDPECQLTHSENLLICKEEYLDEKCSKIESCPLRHPSIEKHIFNELRLCYEFDFTVDNVRNMKKLKLDLYRKKFKIYEATNLGMTFKRLFYNLENLEMYFSEKSLCDKGTSELLNGLKSMNNLKILKIGLVSCQLTDESCFYLSETIKNFPKLKYLEINLSSNNITSVGFLEIFNTIEKFEFLERIELNFDLYYFFSMQYKKTISYSNESFADKSLPMFFQKTEKPLVKRFALSLWETKLNSNNVMKILNIVGLARFTNLKALDLNLNENELKTDGLELLVDQLKNTNLELFYLKISNCQIKNIDSLFMMKKNLKFLKFFDCNFKMNPIKQDSVAKFIGVPLFFKYLISCNFDIFINNSIKNARLKKFKDVQMSSETKSANLNYLTQGIIFTRRKLIYQGEALKKKLKKHKIRLEVVPQVLARFLRKEYFVPFLK